MEPVATFQARDHAIFVRRFEIVVVDGQDKGARVVSEDDELSVGTAIGTSLRLVDPAVSRHHCVVRICERGLELRDLGSTNGTFLDEHEIVRGYIRSGARLRVGGTTIQVNVLGEEVEHPLASDGRFGELFGESAVMRRLYPLLERCAKSDATVLIQGETGTGKELVAEAIHSASKRRTAPFVVIDCSALPRQLAESELFGHAKGSFTGADTDRIGAFELASGGTIVLDEIGELPLDVQPLLLRVLENQTVRRVGTNQHKPIDVRVIAATNRDLRVEVNARRFRADLFHRLDVVRVAVPPLREREGDVALLAEHFWRQHVPDQPAPKELLAALGAQVWPGNVRELRNFVERWVAVGTLTTPTDTGLSHARAKELALRQWERAWVEKLLVTHNHNLTHASRAAQMGRSHLRRLAQEYGLRTRDGDYED